MAAGKVMFVAADVAFHVIIDFPKSVFANVKLAVFIKTGTRGTPSFATVRTPRATADKPESKAPESFMTVTVVTVVKTDVTIVP